MIVDEKNSRPLTHVLSIAQVARHIWASTFPFTKAELPKLMRINFTRAIMRRRCEKRSSEESHGLPPGGRLTDADRRSFGPSIRRSLVAARCHFEWHCCRQRGA